MKKRIRTLYRALRTGKAWPGFSAVSRLLIYTPHDEELERETWLGDEEKRVSQNGQERTESDKLFNALAGRHSYLDNLRYPPCVVYQPFGFHGNLVRYFKLRRQRRRPDENREIDWLRVGHMRLLNGKTLLQQMHS